MFTFSTYTDGETNNTQPLGRPTLELIRNSQNSDGSWGDKNKVYCTSLSILTYLHSFETPASIRYGNSINNGLSFLINQENNIKKEELHIYFWAISEAYGFTGSDELEKIMKRTLPAFKESISWDHKNKPREFFILNQSLHSFRKSFIDIEDFEEFLKELDNLNHYDSLSVHTVKRQWIKKTNLSKLIQTQIDEGVQKHYSNYLDDMILGRYLYLERNKKNYLKFQQKIDSYLELEKYYSFEDHYSFEEKELLKRITPKLVHDFSFPLKYLPSRKTYDFDESLDLVK